MLSIIILSCDSHKKKATCLRHCLASIFNQKFHEYEIVLIDNGIEEDEVENTYLDYLQQKYPTVFINKIKISKTLSRGLARNIGAKAAQGEVLVFMDEDVILTADDILIRINSYHQERLWGCGADRLWTKGNWFNENAEIVLNHIEKFNFEKLLQNSGTPEKYIRGSTEIAIEMRSMIGHFGYVNKALFEKVNGFEDLTGAQSFDDDLLNLKLYIEYGLPKLYPEIKIVHINHPMEGIREDDFCMYSKRLIQKGILDFDSEILIYGGEMSKIITYLNPIRYNDNILNAYTQYQSLLPLNSIMMSEAQVLFWQNNMQLSLDDYCRLSHFLIKAKNLTTFIKEHSIDFDNLAPILESLILSLIISIKPDGSILSKMLNNENYYPIKNESFEEAFQPNADFNQFPCDYPSILNRLNLIKSRYPFSDYLRLGLIGDDDFLAKELQKEAWISTVLIEKDSNILSQHKENDNIQLVELDLLNFESDVFNEKIARTSKVHTFLTDPPYTLHGSLLFIYTGLKLLLLNGEEHEFYLIMNPMIIGKPFKKLIKILNQCDIYLKETLLGFSHYPFPKNYGETNRAEYFTKNRNINNLEYSSTSNLYIFGLTNPNLDILNDYISKELVYKHYES